ncbi:MAG: class IV adenylate cyclase [Blastocatellia bacterium]
MPPTVPREIEVKLRMESVDPLMRAGCALRVDAPRHFEDNWLLDTPDFRLSGQAAILRVRRAAGTGSITYKAKPPEDDAPASRFKERIEIETIVDDPESAFALLEQLGFRKWFRYQKYRTVYQVTLPDGTGLHAMLDETPIGVFLELEGGEEAIARTVRLLGVNPSDYILDSYLALQAEACRSRGRELEDMLFESGEEKR